jgi:hypothetical protein
MFSGRNSQKKLSKLGSAIKSLKKNRQEVLKLLDFKKYDLLIPFYSFTFSNLINNLFKLLLI